MSKMDEEKIILIEAFQPFAQYRNPFTFYYAQTYPLPPKSAIIGMLQNATGRYYDSEFWNIKVSVHGGFESVFWNYQSLIKATTSGITLKKYKGRAILFNQGFPLYGEGHTSQRSPVSQQELFNGHLFIFLKFPKDTSELIDEVREALEHPQKVLYLGRSEDVIFIKEISEIEPEKRDTKSRFFRTSLPTYIKREGFPIVREKFPVYSIGTKVVFRNNGTPVTNKAEITHSTERESEFTTVIYTGTGYVIPLSENIKLDIFRIEINGKKLTFKIPEEFGWL